MTDAGKQEEAALLQAFLRRRDAATFRPLYRCVTPSLFAMAVRLSGSRSQAEELTQEAWCRAVERVESFDGRSAFRTWLTGILINCHREFLRRNKRDARDVTVDTDDLADNRVMPLPVTRHSPADALDVERALTQLAPGYREIVLLHDLSGYTHKEIAGILGIEEGTSKSQLTRGRTQLRVLLATRNDGEPEIDNGGTP